MIQYFIGIDPGIEPAVAVVNRDGLLLAPYCLQIKKIGKEFNTAELIGFLKKQTSSCHYCIEKAQAMPKQGVVSMFNYGRSFGIIVGAVTMSGSPYTLVAPQTWKKIMMPDMDRSDKNAGRLRAMQLWPESAGLFKRKCDQHIAEAALIAEYGRRTLKGSECG